MSETPILRHADPREGFDRTEPYVGSIWGFTIGSILVLVLVIGSLTGYFFKIWNDAEQEKVLTAPDSQLQMVRGRDAWDLTHSMYLDKKTGQVRIPVDRAMELFLTETEAGKPFYPGKATVPKKEEPAAAATPAPGAPGAAAEPAKSDPKDAKSDPKNAKGDTKK
jgi:hypothetical protein